jgi:hypothetical protein
MGAMERSNQKGTIRVDRPLPNRYLIHIDAALIEPGSSYEVALPTI